MPKMRACALLATVLVLAPRGASAAAVDAAGTLAGADRSAALEALDVQRLGALASGALPRDSRRALRIDARRDTALTLAASALVLGLSLRPLEPTHCRLCTPGELDEETREVLRLHAPGAAREAGRASDLLANAVLPAAALGYVGVQALRDRAPGEAGEDALVVLEAVALAEAANAVAKDGVARLRPGEPLGAGGSADRSFYSGHTSFAFSLATATATVATLRGDRAAPWVWGVGLTLATGVGYLRVASDAHWVTDVAAGAAIGGGIGFAVPWLLHRGPRRWRGLDLRPAPGGLALRF